MSDRFVRLSLVVSTLLGPAAALGAPVLIGGGAVRAAPAPARPAAAPAPEAGRSSTEVGALVGVESINSQAADISLRLDVAFPLDPLAPGVGLSFVASGSYTRWSNSTTDFYYEAIDEKLNLYRVVGAARLTFGSSPKIRPYVDAGLGLYTYSWEQTVTDLWMGTGTYTSTTSDTGLAIRLAGGLLFQVTESFSLGGELAFNEHSGDLRGGTSASVAAVLRL